MPVFGFWPRGHTDPDVDPEPLDDPDSEPALDEPEPVDDPGVKPESLVDPTAEVPDSLAEDVD